MLGTRIYWVDRNGRIWTYVCCKAEDDAAFNVSCNIIMTTKTLLKRKDMVNKLMNIKKENLGKNRCLKNGEHI